jgi:hypothetical protein
MGISMLKEWLFSIDTIVPPTSGLGATSRTVLARGRRVRRSRAYAQAGPIAGLSFEWVTLPGYCVVRFDEYHSLGISWRVESGRYSRLISVASL